MKKFKSKSLETIKRENNIPDLLGDIICLKVNDGSNLEDIIADVRSSSLFSEVSDDAIKAFVKAVKKKKLKKELLFVAGLASITTLGCLASYYIGRTTKSEETLMECAVAYGKHQLLNEMEDKAESEGEFSVRHTVGKTVKYLVTKIQTEKPDSWDDDTATSIF